MFPIATPTFRIGGDLLRRLTRKQVTVGFALLGFAAAWGGYAYATFHHFSKPMDIFDFVLRPASVVLCPPQLILVLCLDCDLLGWNGLVWFSPVAALNAALYALIGDCIFGHSPKTGTKSPKLLINGLPVKEAVRKAVHSAVLKHTLCQVPGTASSSYSSSPPC